MLHSGAVLFILVVFIFGTKLEATKNFQSGVTAVGSFLRQIIIRIVAQLYFHLSQNLSNLVLHCIVGHRFLHSGVCLRK